MTPGEAEATHFAEDLKALGVAADVFPPRDFMLRPVEGAGREYEYRRLSVLGALAGGRLAAVCVPVEALLQYTVPRAEFMANTLTLKPGMQFSREGLVQRLFAAGYVRRSQVEGPGQFSVRGDIVDIFPPDMQSPARLEFWDDEIDSISSFDLMSQRRDASLQKIYLSPAREVLFGSTAETRRRPAPGHPEGPGQAPRRPGKGHGPRPGPAGRRADARGHGQILRPAVSHPRHPAGPHGRSPASAGRGGRHPGRPEGRPVPPQRGADRPAGRRGDLPRPGRTVPDHGRPGHRRGPAAHPPVRKLPAGDERVPAQGPHQRRGPRLSRLERGAAQPAGGPGPPGPAGVCGHPLLRHPQRRRRPHPGTWPTRAIPSA